MVRNCSNGSAPRVDVLCEVYVEEIDVQPSLDDACGHGDGVNDVVREVSAGKADGCHVSVHPRHGPHGEETHRYIQLGMYNAR